MLYAEFLERSHFTKEELLASGRGKLVEDPPEGGIAPLPLPPFLMFDRVTKLERGNRSGLIIAEQDIRSDAWFFQCHFANDPVQPGCLGVDAIWQLLGFYCIASGAQGSGRALGTGSIDFQGQIRPYDQTVTYEVSVKRFSMLKESGASLVIGDARVLVDGVPIYTIERARVGVFRGIAYDDYPNHASRHARGGLIARADGEGSI